MDGKIKIISAFEITDVPTEIVPSYLICLYTAMYLNYFYIHKDCCKEMY